MLGLLLGSCAVYANVSNAYHNSHRQVSLGYYRASTARSAWYLAAVGGVGIASVELHSVDVGHFFIFPVPYFSGFCEERYRRYYGQLYAARSLSPFVTAGAAARWSIIRGLPTTASPWSPPTAFF